MFKACVAVAFCSFLAFVGCGASQGSRDGNDPFTKHATGGAAGQLAGGSDYFPTTLKEASEESKTPSFGSGDEKFCAQQEFKLNRLPPEILLVLDRSGSMRQDAQGNKVPPSKWNQTTAAIDATLAATESGVYWGLTVFPSWKKQGDNECATGTIAGVAPGLTQHAQVMTVVNANAPGLDKGRTPTAKAVLEATATLMARTTPNPKFLLLATDGIPNCKVGDEGQNDVQGAVNAVAAAKQAGFATFVVGIAAAGIMLEGIDPFMVLNQLADAGGRPRADATKFYAAGNQQELTTALASIASQAADCSFSLEAPPPAPENITVELNGTRLGAADWSYGAGNRSVIVKGAWCEKLKKGDVTAANVKFGCPGSIVL